GHASGVSRAPARLPVTYSQLLVPREVALGLRGGLVFPDWPQPPGTATPAAPGASPASGSRTAIADAEERAGAAATRGGGGAAPPRPGRVVRAGGVCARLAREPLGLVRAGTVPVRDLARLARDLDLPEKELALLIDLLVESRILAVGGPFGQRSLGLRPEADPSRAAPPPPRAAPLSTARRSADLAVEDHLVTSDRPQPLTARRLGAAPARRHAPRQALPAPPPPRAAEVEALAPILAWRQPMVWPGPTGG